jgi:hypothetical protein
MTYSLTQQTDFIDMFVTFKMSPKFTADSLSVVSFSDHHKSTGFPLPDCTKRLTNSICETLFCWILHIVQWMWELRIETHLRRYMTHRFYYADSHKTHHQSINCIWMVGNDFIHNLNTAQKKLAKLNLYSCVNSDFNGADLRETFYSVTVHGHFLYQTEPKKIFV